MRKRALVCLLSLTLGLSLVHGQETGKPDATEEETEKKNNVGVFVGALSNLDTKKTGLGLGVDYTREVATRIGITALAEYARAGEREILLGAGLEVKPWGTLRFLFAPGVILESSEEEDSHEESSMETFFAFRSGIGYGFEISKVRLVPTVYLDFVNVEDGVDTHIVYGLSVVFPF